MRWLQISKPRCRLHCPYCDLTAAFPHEKSFEHTGQTLSLHACTRCGSLIYDLRGIDVPAVSTNDTMSAAAARAARYVLEHGFSSRYVAMCGLSCLPDIADANLDDYLFVDVGAGMGMASHFMRSVIGIPTLTIEPSFTGKLAQDILGLTVHRAYFEDLPPAVMAQIAGKTCLLHLNSVVEHLVDPKAVLRGIVARANVETLAIIVPDGAALDYDGPFAAALPFLAPLDHRHLPTRLGVEYLLKSLGFPYCRVQEDSCLLMAVGAKHAIAAPSALMVKLGESLLLEHMLRHPHPHIRAGGAARLLPYAVTTANQPLLTELRSRFDYGSQTDEYLAKLREAAWDEIPYDLGCTCYWLAVDAFSRGQGGQAMALLEVTVRFADQIAEDAPSMALTPLEYKWSALLFRAHILQSAGHDEAARSTLRMILSSRCDPRNGPRTGFIEQAQARLLILPATVAA